MSASQLGQYELLEKLGQGGMGVVWKARDPRLNRLAALKVLSADTPISEERRRRFLQEARAASAFNHPNIVTIYEVGCDKGTDFIAMEFVAGKTLDRIIPHAGMPLAEVLRLAVPLADALSKAHAAGITHRDLKPSNIILGDDGTPKLLDFGLAKLADASPPETSAESATRTLHAKTEDGAILGTIAYMSPEQAEGKPVDGRSDIFSFGAVLYEMLAGRRAFQGDTQLSTLTAVMRDDPKPLRSIAESLPPEMDRIISRCLRKDPAWRFQTAADLKVALAELKQESDTGALGGPVAVRRPARKAIWVAAGLVAASAGLAAWRFLPAPRTQEAMRVVPLTTYDGPESHPSFSPDGSQFAFAWTGGHGPDASVYVRMVDGGTPLRLDSGTEPEWSPDGKLIAYLQQASLMLISPLGGTARKLAELARGTTLDGLAWTPDSESVATVDSGNIVLVSIKTGAKRILTRREGRKGDRAPSFSPDGQSLAFAREFTTGAVDLAISSPPGAAPRAVASGHATIGGLAWAPDGKSLIYSATRGNTRGIFRVATSATPKDQPELLPVPYGGDLSVSKPGKSGASRMAVQLQGSDLNIWRLDLSTGQAAPVVSSTMLDSYPQYSPDGSKIAFASDRSGTMQIWVANADGANHVQVTTFGSRAAAPRWSPDGRSIVFSGVQGEQRSIYVVDAQGGEPRRVVDGWRPSWSVDGKSIYFTTRRSGSEQVWRIGVDGTKPVQVTRSGGYEARDSLDGKWLLYIKSNDAPGLWRMPREGGPEELLLPEVSTGNWNPIDGELLYVEGHARHIDLPVKRYWFETGQSKPFGKIDRVVALGTSATRDGRYFLWSRMDRHDSDLVLVENFR